MLWLDCVLFDGEPIAKARLEYLFEKVDLFYICEARYTHQGAYKKALYYETHKDWFAPYLSKIRFIEFGKEPTSGVYENEHRNAPVNTILDTQQEPFIMSCCDIDEIPNLATMPSVDQIHSHCKKGCVRMAQDFYYYNTKWRFSDKWTAPFFMSDVLLRKTRSIQTFRYDNRSKTSITIDCGWHFSYFQSIAEIQRKLESFCHKEYNSETYKNPEHISKCIREGVDLFMRSNKKLVAAADSALPEIFQKFSNETEALQQITKPPYEMSGV